MRVEHARVGERWGGGIARLSDSNQSITVAKCGRTAHFCHNQSTKAMEMMTFSISFGYRPSYSCICQVLRPPRNAPTMLFKLFHHIIIINLSVCTYSFHRTHPGLAAARTSTTTPAQSRVEAASNRWFQRHSQRAR